MKKIHVVTGVSLALLGAMSGAELYFDNIRVESPVKKELVAHEPETREPPHATMPVPVDEVVATYLSGLSEGPEVERSAAIGALLDRLESPEYAKAPLSNKASRDLIKAAEPALDERVVGFIAERARGKTAYAKIVELQDRIPAERLPHALRRAGGKRSVETIVGLMKSTDSPKVIAACALALQDLRDPKLMGTVLERLDETGMLDKPSRLPWIATDLLLGFIETAEGTDLSRGIRVLRTRPSMAGKSVAAFERAFEKGDAQTKQLAVEAVRKALVANVLTAEQGENLLAGHVEKGTPDVLKAELPSTKEVTEQ